MSSVLRSVVSHISAVMKKPTTVQINPPSKSYALSSEENNKNNYRKSYVQLFPLFHLNDGTEALNNNYRYPVL